MNSIMTAQKDFSIVPTIDTPRSVFNRTHGLKTTFDASSIIPIYWDFALPADTHQVSLTAFTRLATPIVPVMDNIKLDFYFFSVPVRILWDNFKKFCGEQINPTDSIAYVMPTIDVTGTAEQTLSDYLGLPTKASNEVEVVSLWHRAYNAIWNAYFRDENLDDSVTVDTDDGPDTLTDYVLLKARKKHDYFTSALPWPQKGDSVELPLGTSAPVTGIGADNSAWTGGPQAAYETDASASVNYADFKNGTTMYFEEDPSNAGYPNIRADLSAATASTVNELRTAYQVQRLLERDARSGTRFNEKIKAHFGVTVPDYRTQRPEFLGHGSIDIIVNPVAKTDFTAGTSGADLSGIGTGSGNVGFTASFVEHSIILGLAVARADLTYSQGIHKHFLMSTQYDMYWPVFAHLGEQAIEYQEIYYSDVASGTGSTTNTDTFGYQERYAEYRYKPSQITGLFRHNATGTLNIWHLSEQFGSRPQLNAAFIEDNSDVPIDRVIATPSEPQFIYDSYVRVKSTRPMPVYSVPGMIDHF